jgi:hypothetical protein
MRVFISYTDDGSKYAVKLEKDLKEQNIAIWIFKKCIKPGKTWLREIDSALHQVDYVLGVITENYLDSIGGSEAYAKISEGLKKKDVRFIPLFFIPIEEVKSVIIPSLQGFDFSKDYEEGFYKLTKFLRQEEKEDAKELLTKIESPESPNPFRRVRAEYFHDDYKLLASAFAEPEKEIYDMIREPKPILIFGGRGSGKTMILKSLIPEVVISRLNVNTFQDASKRGVNFFSIYFRLKKGSLLIYDYHPIVEMGFLKTGLKRNYDLYRSLIEKLKNNSLDSEPVLTAGINAAWAISVNEMNLKILKTTIQNLGRLQRKNFIKIGRKTEEEITNRIIEKLNLSNASNLKTFDDLINLIDRELKKIERYLQNLAIPYATPEANWCQTGIEFLDEIFEILTDLIGDLNKTQIYLLFDEFENLRPFQQTIVNEWIKTAHNFTVKVASKFESMYTNMTLQGQPLQDGQDYFTLTLDYDLFDSSRKKQYQNLLLQICHKLLDIEKYKEKDIQKILGEHEELEFPQKVIDEEIENIRKEAGLEFSPENITEYRNKLGIAAIFRLLRKREKVEGRKSRKKIYGGFETYTYLSSGIIRVFLNLAGMAFYKAESEGINVKEGGKIPVDHQTWAAYVVSRAWLEKIPINLEEYGEMMYQFIADVGDIFRERLLYHATEPETLTISLADPYSLMSNCPLDLLLSHSIRESILCKKMETSSMKPKQTSKIKPREYMINRIYSPILEISYRPRWPRGSEFTTSELMALLNSKTRGETKKKLQKRQHGKEASALGITSLLDYNVKGEYDEKNS